MIMLKHFASALNTNEGTAKTKHLSNGQDSYHKTILNLSS